MILVFVLDFLLALVISYIYKSDFSQFENDIIGTVGNNNNSASMEYIILSSSDSSSSPITGAPISYQDNTDASTNFLANNIDFGEFLDSAADIYPNKLKHAMCGKLTIKYNLDSIFLYRLFFLYPVL